jgi:signal transduction histidine kinase
MQAKQMLATMSNELGSPLSGVVTMAEVLDTIDLHAEQMQLVGVMVTTGDLIFQLINNILTSLKSNQVKKMMQCLSSQFSIFIQYPTNLLDLNSRTLI